MRLEEVINKSVRKIIRIAALPFKYFKAKNTIKYVEGLRTNENEIVIVLLKGIGDTVYGLSFLECLKQEYNPERIIVIGNKVLQEIIELYPYVDKIVSYDTTNDEYNKYKAFMDCERVTRIGEHHFIFNTDPYQKCYGPQKNTIDFLRTQVFKLSENSKITYPRIGASAINSIPDIENKRIVVFNPYSNSIPAIQKSIFEKMAELLKNKGYELYTNLVRGQEKIKGTAELYCPLNELFMIIEKAAGVVSVRSGILDLVINTGTPIFVMYSSCTEKYKTLYDLKAWKGKSPVEQIYCDKTNRIDTFKKFEFWVDFVLEQ